MFSPDRDLHVLGRTSLQKHDTVSISQAPFIYTCTRFALTDSLYIRFIEKECCPRQDRCEVCKYVGSRDKKYAKIAFYFELKLSHTDTDEVEIPPIKLIWHWHTYIYRHNFEVRITRSTTFLSIADPWTKQDYLATL